MNAGGHSWTSGLEGVYDPALLTAALASGALLSGKTVLTDCAIVRIGGEDAGAFLHAQFTAEIAQLEPDIARLAAWCSPKGRVLFLLRVIRADDHFLLLLPRDQAEAFTRRLGMFVLRARVVIERVDDALGVIRCDGTGEQPAGAPSAAAASDGDQRWFIGETAALARLWNAQSLAVLDANAATLASIQRGVAELDAGLADKFLPQELNLDLVDGISFDKGCYPGQEIIARVRYRGRVKKRLQRFHHDGGAEAAAGTPVLDNHGANIGTVVCSATAPAGGAGELLAVVDTEAGPAFLSQTPLTPRPLPEPPGA